MNFDTIKNEIIEKLKPLNLNTIILFGSYAKGKETKDSDIDLLITKNKIDFQIEAKALFLLKDLIKKYKIGFDIVCVTNDFLKNSKDYFFETEIKKRGKILYVK